MKSIFLLLPITLPSIGLSLYFTFIALTNGCSQIYKYPFNQCGTFNFFPAVVFALIAAISFYLVKLWRQ